MFAEERKTTGHRSRRYWLLVGLVAVAVVAMVISGAEAWRRIFGVGTGVREARLNVAINNKPISTAGPSLLRVLEPTKHVEWEHNWAQGQGPSRENG